MKVIEWKYSRIPHQQTYMGSLTLVTIKVEVPEVEEDRMELTHYAEVPMGTMVEDLHLWLRLNRLDKVVILRPAQGVAEQQDTVIELDSRTVDIIRDDLPQAMKLWEPREERR